MKQNALASFLREFGLNEKEIDIYYFISQTGPQKATVIAKKLGMHKIQVYRYLQEMEKRGIIQLVFESPRKYVASPIENLLNERLQTLSKNLENLTAQKNRIIKQWETQLIPTNYRIERFAIIQGEEKLSDAIEELRKNAKKELCSLLPPQVLVRTNLRGDHNKIMDGTYHFKYRVLTCEDESTCLKKVVRRLLKSDNVEVRYTNAQLKPFPIFSLIEEEAILVIQTSEDKICSLLTNNEIIVGLIKNYFEKLWQDAIDARTL